MLFAAVVVCVVTAVLAGGRLLRFAELRVHHTWLVAAAFVLQFLNFKVAPHSGHAAHQLVYLGTYALGGWFLWSNRRLPGLWLVCFGAASNFVVIAANGGVMPGARSAFLAAGLEAAPRQFVNSRAVLHPHLLFLGDVFAVPSWLPFHNVFSVGDLCIVLGVFVGVHRISESRLLPSGAGQFSMLMGERDFMRLWLAQAVSNQGDWVYSLGVVATLARRGAGAGTLALLVIMQAGPRALASTFGGPLADRLSRRRLMIVADLARAGAVATLLFGGPPSMAHLYGVAAVLGVFAALFQPSLQASIPNVVPAHRLVAANALVSVTFQLAVMTGPLMGSLLVARLGLGTAFAVNAASFLLSAVLVGSIHLPRRAPDRSRFAPLAELREGVRYARRTPVVRGVLVVTGMVMLAAAIRGPLEPLFLLRVLHSPTAALGLPAAVWGLGMLLGSSAAPAASRAWPRERMLTFSVALVGVCVFAASASKVLSSLLALWLVAGSGNAVGTIAYQSLLQQRTPDGLRGRIMAASEAVLDVAYLAGVLLAGWLGGHVGLRIALVVAGAMFLLAAATSGLLLGSGRLAPLPAGRRLRVVRYAGPVPLPIPVPAAPEPMEAHLDRMAREIAFLRRREQELLEL
ncbi:MAG: MFS transporter [Actinobacteria bacterium]|nr:MFS transporter [Actinomycetota bacterium]